MYAAHFGLDEIPFEPLRISPEAFRSRSLSEVEECFFYARRNGEGFMLIVGEPGAGKSVAIATIVAAMDSDTPVAVVRHPTLRPKELLEDEAYRKATELDPNFGLAYYSQALALRQAGYDNEAERSMQKADYLGYEPPP